MAFIDISMYHQLEMKLILRKVTEIISLNSLQNENEEV